MKNKKHYRIVRWIEQHWCFIKYAVMSWLEWQDAKRWAKDIHPAWLEIVKWTKSEEARMIYRNKILKAYRGE